MHTTRNRILFYGSALAAGLAALGLHSYMMNTCFDAKGLLISGNLPGKLLWVVGVGFAVFLTAMLTTIGGDGSYEDNFPRCTASGLLMLAAGAVLAWAVPSLGLEQEPVVAVIPWVATLHALFGVLLRLLPWLAAASMAVMGLCRMQGRKPSPIFGGIVCLFYMLMLVTNYRVWSADPKFYEYVFPMLAGVLLMLCSFHRTSCDGGIIQRRRLLFTGFTAAASSLAALSTGFIPWFFISGGLWAAGSVCNCAELPPDPKEETSADVPQIVDELGDVGDHDR